jgi:hypothetical protein
VPNKPDSPKASSAISKPKASSDVALVLGAADDGGVNILRKRADRLEAGTLKPLREGMPIHGEVIGLRARKDSPLYDVEVHVPQVTASDQDRIGPGPAQVATDSYRKNWDQIYSRRRPRTSKELN